MDFERALEGWPMLGFILMVDEFRADNGATRAHTNGPQFRPTFQRVYRRPTKARFWPVARRVP